MILPRLRGNGRTKITVLYQRNLRFGELRSGARSVDYPFGYAEMYVGRGENEGMLIPAARVHLRDGKRGKLKTSERSPRDSWVCGCVAVALWVRSLKFSGGGVPPITRRGGHKEHKSFLICFVFMCLFVAENYYLFKRGYFSRAFCASSIVRNLKTPRGYRFGAISQ